jgi:hypothetical protein
MNITTNTKPDGHPLCALESRRKVLSLSSASAFLGKPKRTIEKTKKELISNFLKELKLKLTRYIKKYVLYLLR